MNFLLYEDHRNQLILTERIKTAFSSDSGVMTPPEAGETVPFSPGACPQTSFFSQPQNLG